MDLRLLIPVVCMCLGATALAAKPDTLQRPNAAKHDNYGNVVQSADGKKHLFTEEHLARLQAVPASAGQATQSAVVPDEGPYTLGLDQVWQMSIWGTSIGRTGMIPVDLDGDGSLEVVVGTSLNGGFGANVTWHVLKFNANNNEYDIIHTAVPIEDRVSRIEVLNQDTSPRIFVGHQNGLVIVYDGATLNEQGRFVLGTGDVTAILLADADNDGHDDLFVGTEGGAHILDPVDFSQNSQISYGSQAFAIGNVDADPAQEIVLVSGLVIEYDGVTPTVEWDYSGFAAGAYLALADLDGDGIEEIVSARSWYYIDIYSAVLQSPIGQIDTDLNIHALLLADVGGDGNIDIVYGDAQWGGIHAIDFESGLELWEIHNPEHGTTNIAIGDTDDDGNDEIMFAGGWTSTGEDYFFVHDLQTYALEFQSIDLVGPFSAVDYGDVDDDGVMEIVAISFEGNSGYADGAVHIWNAETFELEWRSSTSIFHRHAWTGVHDVAIGDVDGDGETEIVVGTDRLYDGAVYIINGATHEVEREFIYNDASSIVAVAVADMNDDDIGDIVAGAGSYAYIIDGVSGEITWQSVSLQPSFMHTLLVENLVGDSTPDIVIAMQQLNIIDGASGAIQTTGRSDLTSISMASLSGGRAILAGTTGGDLVAVNPTDLSVTTIGEICAGQVNSVKAETSSTLIGTVQFACDDTIGIFDVTGQEVIWRSPVLGRDAGKRNNLVVTDRGEQAMLVAGMSYGVVAFSGYGTVNTDIDEDGVPNHLDNCPEIENPGQEDSDGNGMGDACNDAFDQDGDEWDDQLDNCPAVSNPNQADTDGDGVGDSCNDDDDFDGDEWSDALDNCSEVSNPDQTDGDGDLIGDVCDPYPDNPDNYAARCEEAIFNEAQLTIALEACEALPHFIDSDNDGEADATDQCPGTPVRQAVDQAGCSNAQFCNVMSGSDLSSRQACLRSDWRNDEPLSNNPGDCRILSAEASRTFECAAEKYGPIMPGN